MIPLTLGQLADVVGGELGEGAEPNQAITGVSIDSRTVAPGDLFVPLPGEHVDGHAFVAAAMAAGAAGYLCATGPTGGAADGIPGAVLVDDPLDALTGLGAWVRDTVDPLVVAVTGSNGKTTTKDMAAAAIGAGRPTVANPGSFNNEIGLPLTLCLLTPGTEVLVCEIGARGIGHIADVMPMVRPDVAIVTTVAAAHIGEFGSLDAIVQAKGELVEGLEMSDDGVAILNADVPEVRGMADRAVGRVVLFGTADDADVRADAVEVDGSATATITVDGRRIRLPRPGLHQVGNALAALAAAAAVGVDLDTAAAGLTSATLSPWRMETVVADDGLTVINDAYNANLQSTVAALETLAATATTGQRWACLGFMAELGAETGPAHGQVGAAAARLGIDGLVVVEARAGAIIDGAREAGFTGRVEAVVDVGHAADTLDRILGPTDVLLVKASRSVGLEHLVQSLLTDRQGPSDGAGPSDRDPRPAPETLPAGGASSSGQPGDLNP